MEAYGPQVLILARLKEDYVEIVEESLKFLRWFTQNLGLDNYIFVTAVGRQGIGKTEAVNAMIKNFHPVEELPNCYQPRDEASAESFQGIYILPVYGHINLRGKNGQSCPTVVFGLDIRAPKARASAYGFLIDIAILLASHVIYLEIFSTKEEDDKVWPNNSTGATLDGLRINKLVSVLVRRHVLSPKRLLTLGPESVLPPLASQEEYLDWMRYVRAKQSTHSLRIKWPLYVKQYSTHTNPTVSDCVQKILARRRTEFLHMPFPNINQIFHRIIYKEPYGNGYGLPVILVSLKEMPRDLSRSIDSSGAEVDPEWIFYKSLKITYPS